MRLWRSLTFKEVYAALYNSAESIDAMTELKKSLQDLIGPDSVTEVNKITGDIVKFHERGLLSYETRKNGCKWQLHQ